MNKINVKYRLNNMLHTVNVEGLVQLPDTASYRTGRVFRLVPFTYQLEYRCLSATILKFDSTCKKPKSVR